MAFDTSMSAQASGNGVLDTQADMLLKRGQDARINKAATDFESILLGSWLQQAENSFATVPGGDGEDDGDAGKDQFQGIAMQALAGSMTRSGGIGIAKMISKHLHSAADSEEEKKAALPSKGAS